MLTKRDAMKTLTKRDAVLFNDPCTSLFGKVGQINHVPLKPVQSTSSPPRKTSPSFKRWDVLSIPKEVTDLLQGCDLNGWHARAKLLRGVHSFDEYI